jgi:hypothetical protein
VYGGRAMLNLPGHHSTAAIVAEIDNTEGWGDDPKVPNIICRISDCEGYVNIEFDVNTANQLENSLHKIDVMVEALLAMREGFVPEHHRIQDRLDKTSDFSVALPYDLRNAVGKRHELPAK